MTRSFRRPNDRTEFQRRPMTDRATFLDPVGLPLNEAV